MREILFRGKRVDNGEWGFGSLSIRPNGAHDISMPDDDFGSWWYEVDPATVGQFTGLLDKTGKRIFEGDIVECVYDGVLHVYVVVYDLSELGFKATNGKENYGKDFEYLPCCEEVIIIGNVHDNSELIESEEK